MVCPCREMPSTLKPWSRPKLVCCMVRPVYREFGESNASTVIRSRLRSGLLADLDLLHELEIGRFQQAADRRHGPLHNERVAGMQFQPPVGRHPFTLADDADNGYILPLSPVEFVEG